MTEKPSILHHRPTKEGGKKGKKEPKSEAISRFKKRQDFLFIQGRIWALSKKANSLWVKRVHSCIIKEQSLRSQDHDCPSHPANPSWTGLFFSWGRYVNLWSFIKLEMKTRPFVCLDNWHPLGRLYKKYGDRVCSNIRRSLSAQASSIIENGMWNQPRRRYRAIQEICLHTPENCS